MVGILAVWNDRAVDISADYERWYMTDHLPERLAVPGFRSARRYEAVSGDRQFFTFYELDGAGVLDSPAYTERLACPSAMTREIMPRFLGMIRAVFDEVSGPADRDAEIVGGAALVLRFGQTVPDRLPAFEGADVGPGDVVRARLWQAARTAEPPPDTTEARIRPGRDASASGAAVIETTRVEIAERLATRVTWPEDAAIGVFRMLCAFRKAPS